MAEEDVQVVLRGLEAFNRGDIEGLIAVVDPQVIWEEGYTLFPDMPAAYHGPDGMRRWFQEAIVDAWESFSAELLDLRDEGGGIVAQDYRIRACGRGSGAEVDMRIVQTLTVREGKIVHRQIERA